MSTNNTDKIIFDWLSFVVHDIDIEDIKILLGLENCIFENLKGAHGYQDRLYFQSISIHYNGDYNMGIWVEMSGQGCRSFESFGHGNYDYIFDVIIDNPEQFHLTRLDVACDDWSGMLDIDVVCDDVKNQNWVGRFRSWESISSSSGCSCLLGSRKSDCILRIYDKKAERKRTDIEHWVRVEFQMRDDRALQYIKAKKRFSSGVMFALVLNNYCRFVQPDENDVNKSRWDTVDYWANFLGFISESISIYEKPKVEYNIEQLKSFVFHQAGGAIETALSIFGSDDFMNQLSLYGMHRNINPKYSELLKQYGIISSVVDIKKE